MLFIALGVIFGKYSRNSIRYVAKVPGFSLSLHARNTYFNPFSTHVGITWPAGNPTKCPQQESHITAAVQIMSDGQTLFTFIKVPQMNNSWFQISGLQIFIRVESGLSSPTDCL